MEFSVRGEQSHHRSHAVSVGSYDQLFECLKFICHLVAVQIKLITVPLVYPYYAKTLLLRQT